MKLFRVGTTVLALATLTMLVTGGGAAASLGPAPSTDPSGSSTQQGEAKPARGRADLRIALFHAGDDLEAGKEFSFGATVNNTGSAATRPVRVSILLERGFTDVRVVDAPGFTCTIGDQPITCDGGQLDVDQAVQITVKATAPRASGDYKLGAIVDPQNALREIDEDNNDYSRAFHVWPGY